MVVLVVWAMKIALAYVLLGTIVQLLRRRQRHTPAEGLTYFALQALVYLQMSTSNISPFQMIESSSLDQLRLYVLLVPTVSME